MLKILVLIIVIFGFTGCINVNDNLSNYSDNFEVRAMFISHIELQYYIRGHDTETSKYNIRKMIRNTYELGFNKIILQVRSFSDAIYYSEIFPWSFIVSGEEGMHPGFDILEYFIEESHKKNIELHAWINPYRIRHTGTRQPISHHSPAYQLLDTSHVITNDRGTFFNLASEVAKDIIVSGVIHIIENYNVDGIHFDDYFHPGGDFDYEDFLKFREDNPEYTLKDFRLHMVSELIRRVYRAIKDHDENILFGISPEGRIENNYERNFADVRRWVTHEGYLDYIMPQMYYGLHNGAAPFWATIREWEELITIDIDLIPALAFYKVGHYDRWAQTGRYEWENYENIIKRQILLSRNLKRYSGFALFRYDNLFNERLRTNNTLMEIKNMRNVLN